MAKAQEELDEAVAKFEKATPAVTEAEKELSNEEGNICHEDGYVEGGMEVDREAKHEVTTDAAITALAAAFGEEAVHNFRAAETKRQQELQQLRREEEEKTIK